jgi:curli production assembly/transport component CsgF
MSSNRFYALFALFIYAGSGACGELVYSFRNPAFGGNPNNATFLFTEANAENRLKTDAEKKKQEEQKAEQEASAAKNKQTPLQQFTSQIERGVLSRLATNVTSALFSADGKIQTGHFSAGNYTLDVSLTADGGSNISIQDGLTGESTVVEVPPVGAK